MSSMTACISGATTRAGAPSGPAAPSGTGSAGAAAVPRADVMALNISVFRLVLRFFSPLAIFGSSTRCTNFVSYQSSKPHWLAPRLTYISQPVCIDAGLCILVVALGSCPQTPQRCNNALHRPSSRGRLLCVTRCLSSCSTLASGTSTRGIMPRARHLNSSKSPSRRS